MPLWAIVVVGFVLVLTTTGLGLHFFLPSREQRVSRSDLGIALMTGALIAFSVLVLQVMIDFRARDQERRRQNASDRQGLQISVGPTGLRGIDLKHTDLARFYLSGRHLDDADLEAADLHEAVLIGATLNRANLSQATLDGADLTGAELSQADLEGAHLVGTRLTGADLDGANLADAHLESAVLTDAQLSALLRGVHLERATLDGANLTHADLEGAHLRGAWLADADLRGAVLYGADLSHTRGTLRFAILEGARYDTGEKGTRWPPGYVPNTTCRAKRCRVTRAATGQNVLKPLRRLLARELPANGWEVVPEDPAGISLKSKKGDARFVGEASAVDQSMQTADSCQKAFWFDNLRDKKQVVYSSRAGIRFDGTDALAQRYSFDDGSGRVMAADVYALKTGLCFRLSASAQAELFPLFRRDFADLFLALGIHNPPLGDSPGRVTARPPTEGRTS